MLTLICRHDDILSDPNWIHNGTVEGGDVLATAFPGLTMYSFQNRTEHRVTVTEVDDQLWMDMFSSVRTAYRAPSSRAMQSSTHSFLMVSHN